jgi:hypothetical protein
MSPIPEFTDVFSEAMKSDGTSATKVIKDDICTDRNTNESVSGKHSESMSYSSECASRSIGDNKVSEDIDPAHMATEMKLRNSPENAQNEECSQAGGSPMEEHWLEVSISGQSLEGD